MDGRVCARWLGKRKKGRSLGWERPFVRETPHVHLRGDYSSILTGMHDMGYVGKNGIVMYSPVGRKIGEGRATRRCWQLHCFFVE